MILIMRPRNHRDATRVLRGVADVVRLPGNLVWFRGDPEIGFGMSLAFLRRRFTDVCIIDGDRNTWIVQGGDEVPA